MQIKIDNYTKFPDGKVKGVANISILIDNQFPLSINGVKVIDSPHGGHFFALPNREYTNDAGEKKYASICGFFTKDGYRAFQDAIRSAFTEFFNQEKPVLEPPVSNYQTQPVGTSSAMYSNSPDNNVPF